jgi:hypothetical protein
MYNRNQPVGPQNFVKIIVIIHLALFMGQALLAGFALLLSKNAALNLKPGNDPLFYISPIMVIFGIGMGSFLFKQQMAKVAAQPSLAGKLQTYQTALIIRYALIEGPSLFSIVCVLLTGNIYYLIIAGINILYFITIRPTKFKIQEDLNLAYDEQAEMDGKS